MIDNIVPACINCNSRKSDMTEAEFRTAFSEAFKIVTTVASPETKMSFDLIDAPPMRKLREENESVSWAWRNPA